MNLMGAAVTRNEVIQSVDPSWGETCRELLERIYHHPSKASQTYYYRLHYSYFCDMAQSVSEVARVMAANGKACIVVQDSYYKDVHNDLPKILTEMAARVGLEKTGEFAYLKQRSMCRINSASAAYRSKRVPLEVALLLEKR